MYKKEKSLRNRLLLHLLILFIQISLIIPWGPFSGPKTKPTEEQPKNSFGNDCSFDPTKNSVRCDLGSLYWGRKVIKYPNPYVGGLLVSARVIATDSEDASFSDIVPWKRSTFETAIATGEYCNTDSKLDFSDLKSDQFGFCSANYKSPECSRENFMCPPKKDPKDSCCLVIRCTNKKDPCKLKAEVRFNMLPKIFENSQRIPLWTQKITLNGEGFSGPSLPVACFDDKGTNIGCSTEVTSSYTINLLFEKPVTSLGSIYASLKTAVGQKNTSKIDERNRIRIATVVIDDPFMYKWQIAAILGVIIVAWYFFYYKPKQKLKMQREMAKGNQIVYPSMGGQPFGQAYF